MVDIKSAPTFPTWYSLYHYQSVGLKAVKYDKDQIEDEDYELYMDKFIRPIADICGCGEAEVGNAQITHVLTYVKEKKFNYFYRVADLVAKSSRAIPQDQRMDKISMIFDGFFKGHTACYIITKGGNPVVGYAVKRGDIVGVSPDKFARIGNVSKRTGSFDIRALAATPPTQVKTADRKLLSELVRVGILTESSLTSETINCLDPNGNLIQETVNCLSPNIPPYEVSSIIADLPHALINEYGNEYVAALEFAKGSSDTKHRAAIPVLQRMLGMSVKPASKSTASVPEPQASLPELLQKYLYEHPEAKEMPVGNLLVNLGGSSEYAVQNTGSDMTDALRTLGAKEATISKYSGNVAEITEDVTRDILSQAGLSEKSIDWLLNENVDTGAVELDNINKLFTVLGIAFDWHLYTDERIVDIMANLLKEKITLDVSEGIRKEAMMRDRRFIMSRMMQTFRVSTESARMITDTVIKDWTEDKVEAIRKEAAENICSEQGNGLVPILKSELNLTDADISTLTSGDESRVNDVVAKITWAKQVEFLRRLLAEFEVPDELINKIPDGNDILALEKVNPAYVDAIKKYCSEHSRERQVLQAVLETCGFHLTSVDALCNADDDGLMTLIEELYNHAVHYMFSDALLEILKIDQDEMDEMSEIDIIKPDTETIMAFRAKIAERLIPEDTHVLPKSCSDWTVKYLNEHSSNPINLENVSQFFDFIGTRYDFLGDIIKASGDAVNDCIYGARDTAVEQGIGKFLKDGLGMTFDDISKAILISDEDHKDADRKELAKQFQSGGTSKELSGVSEWSLRFVERCRGSEVKLENIYYLFKSFGLRDKFMQDLVVCEINDAYMDEFQNDLHSQVCSRYEERMMALLGLTDTEVHNFGKIDMAGFKESDKVFYAQRISDRILGERPSLSDLGLSDWSIAFLTKAKSDKGICLENISACIKRLGGEEIMMYNLVKDANNVQKYVELLAHSGSPASSDNVPSVVSEDIGYQAANKILVYIRNGILVGEDPEFRAKIVPLIKTFSRMAFLAPTDRSGGADFLDRIAAETEPEQTNMLHEVASFVRGV